MPPSAPDLISVAAAVAGAQQYPAGALYVVATPIGNRADLSLRAIHVLALADAVACEDTRVSAGLLQGVGLERKPLLAVHRHNEREGAATVLERLARGERVAVITDAGTPGISDPGARLVDAVTAAGHRVVPIPGPSSAAVALSVAGDVHGAGFAFAGFLPTKGQERRDALAVLVAQPQTQVIFEAPHRIQALARALGEAAPARRVTVCRELTKQFETVATMDAHAMAGWLDADAQRLRGEFVVVLHAVEPSVAADDALPEAAQRTLSILLRELPLKQAVALAAEITGAPRNTLYEQALALRDGVPRRS